MEQLHLTTASNSRILNIRGFNGIKNKPTVILTCINNFYETEDGDAEHDDASFYLETENIDAIIEYLQKCKEFLKTK